MLDEYFSKHYVAKARLLAALLDHGKISWEMASKDLKISKSTVDSMERRNSSCCDRILLPESWRVQYSKKQKRMC